MGHQGNLTEEVLQHLKAKGLEYSKGVSVVAHDGGTPEGIARNVGKTYSTVIKVCNTLMDFGYVVREKVIVVDRRKYCYFLTESGMSFVGVDTVLGKKPTRVTSNPVVLRMERKLQATEKKYKSLLKQIDEKSEFVLLLKSQIRGLKSEMAEAEQGYREFKRETSKLIDTNHLNIEKMNEARGDLAGAKQEIISLKNVIAGLKREQESIEVDLSRAKKRVVTLEKRKPTSTVKVRQLKEEVHSLMDELDVSEQSVSLLRKEIVNLKQGKASDITNKFDGTRKILSAIANNREVAIIFEDREGNRDKRVYGFKTQETLGQQNNVRFLR